MIIYATDFTYPTAIHATEFTYPTADQNNFENFTIFSAVFISHVKLSNWLMKLNI